MRPYFFLLFLFLFQLPAEKVCSQDQEDSTQRVTAEDSLKSALGDSVETMQINPYSLYRLTSHSGRRSDNPSRQVDSVQIRSYRLNPDYAYANDPEYWKKDPPKKTSSTGWMNGRVIQWIFLSMMAALVIYGIFQLAKENNFTLLSRRSRNPLSQPVTLSQEEEIDLEAAVELYQKEGNYRMAVRFLYLKVLQEMGRKAGILIPDSSTNQEIALAFGDRPAGGEFRFLSRAYEYIYYGDFKPSPDLYQSLRIKFEDFQKSLSS